MDVPTKTAAEKWRAILPVLDEHTGWFHDLMAFLFYPEHEAQVRPPVKPTSFALWFLDASGDDGVQSELVEKLNALHKDLMMHADLMIVEAIARKSKANYEKFNTLVTYYEEFLGHIRRLEHDFVTENGGYDPATGLRNIRLMSQDFTREMDRFTRQGKPFTVAITQLDDFTEIDSQYSTVESSAFIKLVANLLKISTRSYDDAYYMGKGRFFLILKQAEMKGGVSALERLRRELERQSITYRLNDHEKHMRMTCCIAMPSEADVLEELIANLEKDLNEAATRKMSDTVLEYYELSPLQRFMKDQQGGV